MNELDNIEKDAVQLIPRVVQHHREAGILTWALLHRIEREVIDEIAKSGQYRPVMLNMIRATPLMGYPNDDRPVSLVGHEILPLLFDDIVQC